MRIPVTKSLDPESSEEWDVLRLQGHRMLDDMFDYLQQLRARPVWQSAPEEVRQQFQKKLPHVAGDLAEAHADFMQNILPYSAGNAHPGFMGWVQGGGNPVGMLAEMLAAGMNANVGGRNQIPVEVEGQVTQWVRELFQFPETASGLFVTGTSMANLVAVWVARARAFGFSVRQDGLQAQSKKLVAYTSVAAHACISQAMDLSGLGSNQLRIIPVLDDYSIDCQRLQQVIQEDRLAGLVPFFVAGTAGTVDVGAIDDLPSLADIAQQEQLWFHIDGAYGALAMLSPEIAPRLSGIERADSIAFDFHKWAQVPYDAGYILIRDGQAHYDTFASDVGYLRREQRGLAAGSLWPCDYGPDLSRGFRALKTWFTIQVYGADRLGEVILQTCQLAQYLKEKILATSQLELLAPVSLNIVCFRYRCEDSDSINAELAVALQESGIVAPSTNIIRQQLALRAAIVNHRTTAADIDALIDATLRLGAQLLQEKNISQN